MVALSLFRGKEEGGGPIYKSEVDINQFKFYRKKQGMPKEH